ncbi:RT0821/Lpp0805 family surface protein [Azospirillum halopraeferens]|uniref:RT0821/Lpp0805 family surface protein n=1 Tax=Azospirillum halopraeferens TaxID=34010 RepID=UPI00048D3EAD|nr:RT0821/Lpp0805 family surface protein [Azospirillum halopraeferens]
MRLSRSVAALLCSALLVTGCMSSGTGGGYGYGDGGGNKQMAGAVLGGVVGGLAGSRFGGGTGKLVAVGVGTLLGAALGSAAGASMDRADLAYAQQAERTAYGAPVGQTISWNNPQNGNWGSYTPVRDGYASGGQYCREFQTTASIGGRMQQVTGTACQQADGSWRMVQ